MFTTNYVDKLDPALIRRGRRDKHIELSCCLEAFKVLARNYLDLETHELFERITRLLGETDMTPADVADNLMPKSDVVASWMIKSPWNVLRLQTLALETNQPHPLE